MSELFGFQPDEDGHFNFMTIQLEVEIENFQDYMGVFSALVQMAVDNAGYMPIITFDQRYGDER